MSAPLDLIVAWHDVVRDRDLEALAALVHSDVEVGGPKGSGHGSDLIREWVEGSGIELEIESFLQRGLTFVVGQTATWPDPEAEGGRTEPVPVASVFVVQGARISKVLRFDDVDTALEAAGFRTQ
ncbi:MAG: nuclear transport factor 2 family protein [Geodermatophilaceae bacterium]